MAKKRVTAKKSKDSPSKKKSSVKKTTSGSKNAKSVKKVAKPKAKKKATKSKTKSAKPVSTRPAKKAVAKKAVAKKAVAKKAVAKKKVTAKATPKPEALVRGRRSRTAASASAALPPTIPILPVAESPGQQRSVTPPSLPSAAPPKSAAATAAVGDWEHGIVSLINKGLGIGKIQGPNVPPVGITFSRDSAKGSKIPFDQLEKRPVRYVLKNKITAEKVEST